MGRVFVRFLEEIEDSTKTFRNYLTFKGRFYSESAGKIWNLQSCEPNIVPDF